MTTDEKLKKLYDMVKSLHKRVQYLSFYINKGKDIDNKLKDEIDDVDKTMK